MGLIDCFGSTGEFSVKETLISEGFEQCKDGFSKTVSAKNDEILIKYKNNTNSVPMFHVELNGEMESQIAVQSDDSFFERYGMLMEKIRDILRNNKLR